MADKRVVLLGKSTISLEDLMDNCREQFPTMDTILATPFEEDMKEENLSKIIERITSDNLTKIVFFMYSGESDLEAQLAKIRKNRKDIYLCVIRFFYGKTTFVTPEEMYFQSLECCKKNSCNLVMAVGDEVLKLSLVNINRYPCMIVAPEETYYHLDHWEETLPNLVEMAKLRSNLTFTQSKVLGGRPIPWDSDLIPNSLKEVIDYCIKRGAYKPFRGATAGHFAIKLDDQTFLTSIRRTDFNSMKSVGLVKVVTDGPDTVLAYGAKPSVGGQSQRIVFKDHNGYDCIVHFHCPIREGSEVPTVSQREYECGSHECGKNTSGGLKQFGNLKAVYLDNHGPNIIFNKNTDSKEIIDFIEKNFDLEKKTGGFVPVLKINEAPNSTLQDAKDLLTSGAN